MDYLSDQEFLELLLKEKIPQIREQIHEELEMNGQELPEEIKINYYLEHLLDD